MRCPVCRARLSDYAMHLKAMPRCRQQLYDNDRVLIIDRYEILEGTLYRELAIARRLWWVKGLDVAGNRVSIRAFRTKAVADIFMQREQAAYGARGGDPQRALRPRIEHRPKPNLTAESAATPRIAMREMAASKFYSNLRTDSNDDESE